MILSRESAKHIIDLNPYNSIDKGIADRQFEVIVKGFNFLMQEDSDFLYVADEVGLGKTYVALGIASLLRHFSSSNRQSVYKDVIIVPKRNLQYKWIKEANSFILNNYKLECNIVKSVLGSTVGDCSDSNIHHYLDLFNEDYPSYEIYRNSSFSIATTEDKKWELDLENRLQSDELKTIFKEARGIYRKGADKIYLKRLFAYLLNIEFPEIDLLIVDEAHHYKHGVGNDVSYRNQVVSRLMGVLQEEDDEQIFSHFPELKSRIKKKAKKVIFLSATPIDNGLYELKNQLDCFIPSHRFKNSENINDDVKEALNTFMIRGLMNIKLEHEEDNNGIVSRNMYRHEHRNGNVVKKIDAKPQYIEDDLESMIIGLMQFKTLQHFNESNNKSFEIGMLAGFETFNSHTNSEKEYEETSSRSLKESEDQDIIKEMADSYFEEFKCHLPHPKQDKLIEVLFEGIKTGNKSLVFVRRIASVIELERKLTHKVESWQYSIIKKYLHKSSRLKTLKKDFEERHQIIEIEQILEFLGEKLYDNNKRGFHDLITIVEDCLQLINEYLIILYHSEEESIDLNKFRRLVKNQIGKKNLKKELKDLSYKLLVELIDSIQERSESEGEEQFPDIKDDTQNYFFSSYFSSKRYVEGFNFRKRASTKDWYRFNYYHLTEVIPSIQFDIEKLQVLEFSDKEKLDSRRMDIVNDVLVESFFDGCNSAEFTPAPLYLKKTFFNLLFEQLLKDEFQTWINNKWGSPSKGYSFYEDLDALIEVFQGVFRNGSGILPAYIAESLDKDDFEVQLIALLKESFNGVLDELKLVLKDFDKILATNFSNRTRIQRALYGQHPIAGVSGFHKRDISRVATQFRMPGYPYVLITTDVLKEGEDLHLYCKDVYHYGIAWNPSDMEQRTGRIDRINSSCYFKLQEDGKRNFKNALQVFYPYLADTLEVNQVSKVFNKMNDFVETFYDISVQRKKDVRVSTDAIVETIPVQIKDFLTSKYDYQNFKGIRENAGKSLLQIKQIGKNKDELKNEIEDIYEILFSNFHPFVIVPKIHESNFLITANINLNGRRAPLRIVLVKGEYIENILFSIESIICRSTELRTRVVRDEIRSSLDSLGLDLIENNDFLLVRKKIELSTQTNDKIKVIKDVIQVADSLEEKYTNGDLEGF